jgi:hypothetical protein
MRHGARIADFSDGVGTGGLRREQSGFFPGSFREAWDADPFLSAAVRVKWLHIAVYWVYATGNPPWAEQVHVGQKKRLRSLPADANEV